MPDTNFGEIANLRWNQNISNFDKIKSKEDYIKKLEDYLSGSESGRALINAKTRSFDSISNDAFENSNAKKIVEENSLSVEDLKLEALRFEESRASVGRLRDESRTAKDTRPINQFNFISWRKHPNRMDLNGIDTRRSRRGVSVRRASRELVLSKGDRRLVNVRPFVDVKRRVKYYRSSKSGRFVPNPFKKK